jgi:hypothetical protein
MNKLKTSKRDIQIHAVVTITNRVNNVEIINEKEKELPQFAVQIDSRCCPVRRKDVQTAFGALYIKCLDEMRKAGILRSGD